MHDFKALVDHFLLEVEIWIVQLVFTLLPVVHLSSQSLNSVALDRKVWCKFCQPFLLVEVPLDHVIVGLVLERFEASLLKSKLFCVQFSFGCLQVVHFRELLIQSDSPLARRVLVAVFEANRVNMVGHFTLRLIIVVETLTHVQILRFFILLLHWFVRLPIE